MSTATDLPRPRFARMYLKKSPAAERRGATEHRQRLLDGLSGTVLELGAGHGLNFPHYPTTVAEVIAIEPEPTLRAAAARPPPRHRSRSGCWPVVADRLPLDDHSVDAAVASLVLCSVPDQDRALASCAASFAPAASSASTSTSSPTASPDGCCCKPPTTAASGHGSPAAATPPATPAPRSSATDSRIQSCDRIMFAASRLEPSIPHILGRAIRM